MVIWFINIGPIIPRIRSYPAWLRRVRKPLIDRGWLAWDPRDIPGIVAYLDERWTREHRDKLAMKWGWL